MPENLGQATLRLTADSSGLRRGLADAQQKLRQASFALTAAGAALTAPLAAGVKVFGEYEQAMAKVRAVSGATGEEFEALDNIAREMGRTTVFTAREAASALSFMSMAGMEASQSVAALPDVLNLAAAGQLELGNAADIVTNVMAGYGIQSDQLTQAVDVLTFGFTSANTNLQQLGDAFTYAGPVAKAAGMSFEETAAALSLMGNAGFQGSLAGTALRGAITRMLNPSKEAEDILKRLGVQIFNTEGDMRPLVDIIRDLESGGVTAGDAMTLFGQRAGPALLALIEQGSGALEQMTLDMEGAGGTAERIAKTQLDTLHGQLTLLKSAFEGIAISIGQILVPVIRDLLDKVTPVVQSIVEWTDENPKLTQAIVMVAGAVGGLLLALGGLGFIIGPIGAALAFLASGPVIAIGAAIVGLGALIWTFRDELKELAEWLGPKLADAWHNVLYPALVALGDYLTGTLVPYIRDVVIPFIVDWKVAFAAVGAAIAFLVGGPLVALGAALVAAGIIAYEYRDKLQDIAQAVWSVLLPALQGLWAFLSGTLVPYITGTLIPTTVSVAQYAWRILVDFWQAMLKPALLEVWRILSEIAGWVVAEFIPTIVDIAQYAWQLLVDFWHTSLKPTWTELIATIRQAIVPALVFLAGVFVTHVVRKLQLMWGVFQVVWPAIRVLVTSIIKGVFLVLKTYLSMMLAAVRLILALIRGDWQAAWQAIKDFYGAIWRDIAQTGKLWWGVIQRGLHAFLTVAKVAWSAAWAYMKRQFNDTFNAIKNLFTTWGRAISRTWTTTWNGLVSIVRSAVNRVIGYINRLISAWNRLSFSMPGFSIPSVSLPSWMGGHSFGGYSWGGFTINTPNIPHVPMLAQGGIVRRPTLAMVGEAGPEAVVPLGRGGGIGGHTVNIVIEGNVMDGEDFAQAVQEALLLRQRQGRLTTEVV